MIRRLAKILPYGLVMHLSRTFCGDIIHTKELGDCRGWRIDKGEWVLYSEDNYKRMRENEDKQKQTKLDKKKEKVQKMFDKDFNLKQEIKKEFDYEEQQKKEERECYN